MEVLLTNSAIKRAKFGAVYPINKIYTPYGPRSYTNTLQIKQDPTFYPLESLHKISLNLAQI